MIHSRSAQKELVDLLTPFRTRGAAGVFHSFGGTVEEARELLSFGIGEFFRKFHRNG